MARRGEFHRPSLLALFEAKAMSPPRYCFGAPGAVGAVSSSVAGAGERAPAAAHVERRGDLRESRPDRRPESKRKPAIRTRRQRWSTLPESNP